MSDRDRSSPSLTDTPLKTYIGRHDDEYPLINGNDFLCHGGSFNKRSAIRYKQAFYCPEAAPDFKYIERFPYAKIFFFPYRTLGRILGMIPCCRSNNNCFYLFWICINFVICAISDALKCGPLFYPYYFSLFFETLLIVALLYYAYTLYDEEYIKDFLINLRIGFWLRRNVSEAPYDRRSSGDIVENLAAPGSIPQSLRRTFNTSRLRKFCFKKSELLYDPDNYISAAETYTMPHLVSEIGLFVIETLILNNYI